MSNANEASTAKKIKVGLFTIASLLFMGVLTIYVNNRPFWWRHCETVQVTVEDATGLKTKAPVKSLGLEIGYISDIGLVSTGVRLNICVTAPVEIQQDTKAYVRGEGFLGDRFLELKPVKYIGSHKMEESAPSNEATATPSPSQNGSMKNPSTVKKLLHGMTGFLISSAEAQTQTVETTAKVPSKNREIPMAGSNADAQQVMNQLNSLVKDLKTAINPEEIRDTIRQLNKTLEEASKAFSPQGGLTATAQRSLIKLEDAIEQLRDQVTRINQGQGSVGMVLNDPVYAEELKKALVNLNHLLNRASDMRLNVILGINALSAYEATRASFDVMIYPRADRFYHLGIASDPRGSISQTITTTQGAGGNTTLTNTQVNKGGFAFTAQLGKVFYPRLMLGVGLLYGDGAASLIFNLGWNEEQLDQLQLVNDLYFRAKTNSSGNWTAQADDRIYVIFQPISIIFLSGGIEGLRNVEGNFSAFFGAGIRFEDEDIRLLFSFL